MTTRTKDNLRGIAWSMAFAAECFLVGCVL